MFSFSRIVVTRHFLCSSLSGFLVLVATHLSRCGVEAFQNWIWIFWSTQRWYFQCWVRCTKRYSNSDLRRRGNAKPTWKHSGHSNTISSNASRRDWNKRRVYGTCSKALFRVAVNGTKIAHLGKYSFSEWNGNDENVWRTSEVVDSRFAELWAKQLRKVGNHSYISVL